ncbi:hypothetical protein [Yersinia enterocolitica]|uniref:hypothetical protein n=1 Tax=Yersinia enterocolitica TaxID=630 RepID=UPI001C61064D|nr:hypothetical protein [Yersinia enterocolitica]MBW5840140.1 hypothetical protein [Yersinia enterocolitica]
MQNDTFFERYQPIFEIVCRILGNGWRINLLDDCLYRIKLTSPQYKNFSIHIRMEKGRLVIIGSVDSRSWRSPYHTCTVSPERNPVEIAADIEKKILIDAFEDVKKAREYERQLQQKQEQTQILKGMLSRLIHLYSWHGTFTGFKVENGLDGNVSERGDGYEMVIRGLSVEQLIKVAGFIKQL